MGISIDEKRVYRGDGEDIPVYVVGDFGVAVVETSDDMVGRFGLERRCTARDAAGRDGRLAVATDETVLIGGEDGFESLDVGPAVAVGFGDAGDLLVAREDGAVLRREEDGDDGDETGDAAWTELGSIEGVRAIDGDLLAAESGVYRATASGVEHVGLADVRDVSTAGVPLAATAEGLYKLGNGWMDELDGDFRAVGAASGEAGRLGWAHAAGESGLFAHEDGEWRAEEIPAEGELVALDHGEGVYAATADGTFLLSVGDGWRSQMLGLQGVKAVAAP